MHTDHRLGRAVQSLATSLQASAAAVTRSPISGRGLPSPIAAPDNNGGEGVAEDEATYPLLLDSSMLSPQSPRGGGGGRAALSDLATTSTMAHGDDSRTPVGFIQLPCLTSSIKCLLGMFRFQRGYMLATEDDILRILAEMRGVLEWR